MTRPKTDFLISSLPKLSVGQHDRIEDGACVMEAVAFVAGEPFSDHPKCACPVIGSFLRSWNDLLFDGRREELLKPLVLRLIGTKSTPKAEQHRAFMCVDWLIRTYTPAWLSLSNLSTQADMLAGLPEIVDIRQCASILPTMQLVRTDSAAARDAAWAAARNAARDAARDAAWAATGAAAGAAARCAAWYAARDSTAAAAWDAAWYAVKDAAWAAAKDAVRDAARDAAWDAAWDALRPTVIDLQKSALALVNRMIEEGAAQ